MHGKIYIAIGSNLGDRDENVRQAYRRIEERIGGVVSKSTLIRTAPEGFESDQEFVNGVFELQTDLEPEALLKALKKIEADMGRAIEQKKGYSDRIIDLDIIDYGGVQITAENIQLPHPRMQDRLFVLKPLQELNADWVHPRLKMGISELINRLPETLSQNF